MVNVQRKLESNFKSFIGSNKSGVYLITCFGGKKERYYVGEAINIKNRIHHHKAALRNNRHRNNFLQSCFSKYGEDSFTISILEYCEKSVLLQVEAHYIDLFGGIESNKVFNHIIQRKGEKRTCTDKVRKKMSASIKSFYNNNPDAKKEVSRKQLKRFKDNPDLIRQMSLKGMKGKRIVKLSLEGEYIKTYDCLLDINKDIPNKQGTKIKKTCNGKSNKVHGFKWQWEKDYLNKEPIIRTVGRKRKVNQMDLDGNFIKQFDSLTQASKETGTSRKGITKCVRGIFNKTNGFKWEYVDKDKYI